MEPASGTVRIEQRIERALENARWWGAIGGALLALMDTAFVVALGIRFEINGRDGTFLVAAFFGSSFVALGFLVGYVVEGRRRDRRTAEVIRSQMEAINAARARLIHSEKLAALGQLAATIAHEVRNPLAVIRSAAQGLAEALPQSASTGREARADQIAAYDDSRRACVFITDEIDRLSSVITSLLDFARPQQLGSRPIEVAELFNRVLLLAGDEIAAKQVRLHRSEPHDLPAIQGDPDLLCQVLLGLLSNAIAAVSTEGEVALEARRLPEGVEMVIADSGHGISPENRDRVFEPFFTTRERGIGLGLAIARQIVEAHGGQIEAGDRPGGGARFAIRFPAAPSAAIAAPVAA